MRRALVCSSLLLVLLDGCNCGGARVQKAAPLAEAQPLVLDFGPVPVGLTARLSFRLRNLGSVTLTVSKVAVDGAPFAVAMPPTSVASGDHVDVEVTFSPTAEGAATGRVTLSSDADDNPSLVVSLNGQGVPRGVCAVCTMPPANYCTPGNELIVYQLTGSCVDGKCQYFATTIPCPAGCNTARAECRAPDAGVDAGAPDAGAPDAGVPDAGPPDAGAPDAGAIDAGPPDAGAPDAGVFDAGPVDAGYSCAAGLDLRPDLNLNGVPDCAENMLLNGQFPGATSPWTSTLRGTVGLDSTDEYGFAGSGSARVVNTVATTTANGGGVLGECVQVNPSSTYGIYLRYFFASGQPGGDATAAAWTTVLTYSDTACAMPYSGVSGAALGSVKDAWATYKRVLMTSSNDRSIRIELGVLKGPTTSDVSALFDNVLLIRE